MTQKRITIYDIAKEAGVSPATVSRILSGSASVKAEKRELVMRLVEKYDFRPNALAKGLSETHSKMIGMMCPDVRNPYYSTLFVECEQVAYELGYTLMLNNTFSRQDLDIAFLRKMMELRVESIIVCGGVLDWRPWPEEYLHVLDACARQVPVVTCGDALIDGCHQVTIDHAGGVHQAVRHFRELGHERIAFMNGHSRVHQSQVKLEAFHAAMAENGLKVRPEYIVDTGSFDEAGGSRSVGALLSLPERPTAILVINDMTALGVMQTLGRLGYSVPGDFSIIGCDDIYLSESTQPPLTTIHVDYAAIARQMVETAVEAISTPIEPSRVVMPTALVKRESCRNI